MSIRSVKLAIKDAMRNGRITAPEMRRIGREAERDGRISRGEEQAIRRLVDRGYFDAFTSKAREEADSFFCRNDLPASPPRVTTFGPPGEEDGWGCRGGGGATTEAVGEEDGGGRVTTLALGEEDGGGMVTTQAIGEES
jgi:hypothetical protein